MWDMYLTWLGLSSTCGVVHRFSGVDTQLTNLTWSGLSSVYGLRVREECECE